jgi:DNA-directed RNA polymerase beta' subunit
MGHIDLMTPISHIWYLKGTPSYILLFLKDLEEKAMRIEKKIYRYKIKKENTRRAKLNKKHKQLIKDQPELRLTKLSIKFPYPLFTLKNLEEIIYFKQGEKWQLREHHFLNSFFDQDLNYDLRHFFEKT